MIELGHSRLILIEEFSRKGRLLVSSGQLYQHVCHPQYLICFYPHLPTSGQYCAFIDPSSKYFFAYWSFSLYSIWQSACKKDFSMVSLFLYDFDQNSIFIFNFQDGLEVHQKNVILISMNVILYVLERAMTTPRHAEPT